MLAHQLRGNHYSNDPSDPSWENGIRILIKVIHQIDR